MVLGRWNTQTHHAQRMVLKYMWSFGPIMMLPKCTNDTVSGHLVSGWGDIPFPRQ